MRNTILLVFYGFPLLILPILPFVRPEGSEFRRSNGQQEDNTEARYSAWDLLHNNEFSANSDSKGFSDAVESEINSGGGESLADEKLFGSEGGVVNDEISVPIEDDEDTNFSGDADSEDEEERSDDTTSGKDTTDAFPDESPSFENENGGTWDSSILDTAEGDLQLGLERRASENSEFSEPESSVSDKSNLEKLGLDFDFNPERGSGPPTGNRSAILTNDKPTREGRTFKRISGAQKKANPRKRRRKPQRSGNRFRLSGSGVRRRNLSRKFRTRNLALPTGLRVVNGKVRRQKNRKGLKRRVIPGRTKYIEFRRVPAWKQYLRNKLASSQGIVTPQVNVPKHRIRTKTVISTTNISGSRPSGSKIKFANSATSTGTHFSISNLRLGLGNRLVKMKCQPDV